MNSDVLEAAAPELFAELSKVADFLAIAARHFEEADMPGWAGNCKNKEKSARAALAKARGETTTTGDDHAT